MDDRDVAVHALEVAPETLEPVDAHKRSEAHPNGKCESGPHKERGVRAILRVFNREKD
jgi:hypothetical protein